jgi:hypothetical protein
MARPARAGFWLGFALAFSGLLQKRGAFGGRPSRPHLTRCVVPMSTEACLKMCAITKWRRISFVALVATLGVTLAPTGAMACGSPGHFGGCLGHGQFDPTIRESSDVGSDFSRLRPTQRYPWVWTASHRKMRKHS